MMSTTSLTLLRPSCFAIKRAAVIETYARYSIQFTYTARLNSPYQGCDNFVPVAAYHIYLTLLATLSKSGNGGLAKLSVCCVIHVVLLHRTKNPEIVCKHGYAGSRQVQVE